MLQADVAKFNKELDKFRKAFPEMQEDILKKVSMDGLKELQDRTPEDTRRARGGWNSTVNGPPSSWKPPEGLTYYPDQPFRGEEQIKFDSYINLSNNVEYIVDLDNGHSKIQAPEGIVNFVFSKMKAHLKSLLAVANRRRF